MLQQFFIFSALNVTIDMDVFLICLSADVFHPQ
jgi:hypothetical protein